MENLKNLSQSEKYVLENKDIIIKLNEPENEEEVEDLTEEILNLTTNFKLGEMVHTADFTLEETMNAVELNHIKMDAHCNYQEANTYRKLLREGKIKKMEDLTMQETLSLIDNLFTREMMWLYGSPIYQTIFNLVYFTDESINTIKSDNTLFRIFLDSSLHMIYMTYSAIVECGCLREEDILMIPIQNASELKREKVFEELKNAEAELKNKLKSLDSNHPDKKVYLALINRIKMRREFLTLIKEQFDFDDLGDKKKNYYKNLIVHVNLLKEIIAEIITKQEENTTNTSTDIYFCDNLCRISFSITSIKLITNINFKESVERFEKILNNLTNVSKIYDMKEFVLILKSIEILNNEKPSFLVRCILELNLFPKGSNLLFGQIDYPNLVNKTLSDFKINFLDENSELITNVVNINKELFLKNLKNRTRQVRDSSSLFEGLAYLVLEANQTEKELKKNTKLNKRTTLTNFFLRQVLQEMITHIWTSFELELFAGFELDYIFYISQTIVEHLCSNTQIVANSFAEKILKEPDFVKSNSKKKLEATQKMMLDEIHIYNGLRCALKGITLMCRYVKLSGIINNPQSEETEQLRVQNRFPSFKNCKFFIDLSYDTFIKDTYFDVESEKEMILQSADSYLKQAIKFFNELKSADLKLRDAFNYSNVFIENLSKAVICNNLLLSKIKKCDKKGMKLTYNMKKYDIFLPILELTGNGN